MNQLQILTLPSSSQTLLWGSDWHLDHLKENEREAFYERLAHENFTILVLAGDIELAHADARGECIGLIATLKKIQQAIQRPVFFVCGNHDYYLGSIEEVRDALRTFTLAKDRIVYLEQGTVVELSPKVAMIGQDGWGDGRCGDFYRSGLCLNDFLLIEELKVSDSGDIFTQNTLTKMQKYADMASEFAQNVLPALFTKYDHVLFITHVPPFREASLYMNKPASDQGAPFFVNYQLGQIVLKIMKEYANKQLTILCGHTHNMAKVNLLPNLQVIVSKSQYNAPAFEEKIVL